MVTRICVSNPQHNIHCKLCMWTRILGATCWQLILVNNRYLPSKLIFVAVIFLIFMNFNFSTNFLPNRYIIEISEILMGVYWKFIISGFLIQLILHIRRHFSLSKVNYWIAWINTHLTFIITIKICKKVRRNFKKQ